MKSNAIDSSTSRSSAQALSPTELWAAASLLRSGAGEIDDPREDIAHLLEYIADLKAKPLYPVGVSVLLTRRDQLLLGKRRNVSAKGLYSTPGGRIEPDEDMASCAIRETREETDVILRGLKIIDWREHRRFGQHYFMFYAHATEWSGEIRNLEPEKCEGWEWFDLDQIPAECTEPPEIIEQLKIEAARSRRIA